MTSLINQNANNDASIIDQLCSVEDETRGLSNGDEPQCLMSTDAGEETDDFGDSGDATECAEDVNDPEDPKLVDPTSSLGINLQQTASAKTTAAIAASLKSRKRPSDQQHSSEKRPKTSSKNRRKNIRNVLSSKELNEDTLAALQAEQERLQRSSKPVSSDLNRLLFGDPSDIGCSSNEAACSSAPKKQKTELTDIHKTQVIKLEATDAVNEANEGPFKFDAQDVNNLNVNNAIHPNAAECEAVKPDLVFLSDDEDDICVQSKSTNNFRHG